jgi:hypothetical protein
MVGRVGSSVKEKKKRKKGLVMRKLFLMLAVLLVASAAYAADATISCTADGNVVTVSYTASAEANIPRAFSLDIQLSTDATITDVTPLDPNFWVYPGSYGDDPCTPVGDPCDSDDTLPGEDSNGLTIEMASLHSPPEVNSPNAPDISNALLSFKVSGSDDCNVYISGNAARGKVVFYDATNEDDGRDVVYTGCEVVIFSGPDCWTWPFQCYGDSVNNDGLLNSSDFLAFRPSYNKTYPDAAYNPCCDSNRDGRVNSTDFLTFRSNYNKDVSGNTPCTPGGTWPPVL